MVFLDTNLFIVFLARNQVVRTPIAARMERAEEMGFSSILACELDYGAVCSANPARNRQGLEIFSERVPIIPFSRQAL